jgi:hypothetical protein
MDLVPAPGGESSSLKTAVVEPEVMASGDKEQEPAVHSEETRPEDEIASHSEPDTDSEASGEEWETESLYEDSLQFVRDEQLRAGGTEPLICDYMIRRTNCPFSA